MQVSSLDLNFAIVGILAIFALYSMSTVTILALVVTRRPEIILKLFSATADILAGVTDVLRPRR